MRVSLCMFVYVPLCSNCEFHQGGFSRDWCIINKKPPIYLHMYIYIYIYSGHCTTPYVLSFLFVAMQ